jgi:hypothetical protein
VFYDKLWKGLELVKLTEQLVLGALDAGNQYYLFIVVDVTTFKPLAKNPECRIINTYLKVMGII